MKGEGEIERRPARRLAAIVAMAFVTGLSGAMMPGPLLVAVIEQTSLQGMWAMFWLVTGHALLELVLVVLLVLGLRTVIKRPRVRAAIGLVGGVALVYMGVDMVRHAWHISLDLSAAGAGAYSWPKLIVLGAAVCAVNPYFTGWWATVGAGQLAHTAPRTALEYLGFYLGHEASDYGWYALVGLLITGGRRWITDGGYGALILGCGVVLVVLGLWFLGKGFLLIRGAKAA